MSEPKIALQNAIRSLRPGGVLYIGIHLYTSKSANITASALLLVFRCCLSERISAHQLDLSQLSSYLNEWRLSQWRSLFEQEAKGCEEFLKSYTNFL